MVSPPNGALLPTECGPLAVPIRVRRTQLTPSATEARKGARLCPAQLATAIDVNGGTALAGLFRCQQRRCTVSCRHQRIERPDQ
jgi:hypothetical protein